MFIQLDKRLVNVNHILSFGIIQADESSFYVEFLMTGETQLQSERFHTQEEADQLYNNILSQLASMFTPRNARQTLQQRRRDL